MMKEKIITGLFKEKIKKKILKTYKRSVQLTEGKKIKRANKDLLANRKKKITNKQGQHI